MSANAQVADESGHSPAGPRKLDWDKLAQYGAPTALVAILIFNILVTPNFLQLQTLFVGASDRLVRRQDA